MSQLQPGKYDAKISHIDHRGRVHAVIFTEEAVHVSSDLLEVMERVGSGQTVVIDSFSELVDELRTRNLPKCPALVQTKRKNHGPRKKKDWIK